MIGTIDRILTSTYLQKFVNQNQVGRGFGNLADSPYIPKWLLRKIINAFIKNYQIDMDEYDYDILSARCFNEFFSRPLKADQRPLASGIISPVDGQITQLGELKTGMMLQVKGKEFALNDLIGEDACFLEGHYAVIYLSPGDYHRFHAPADLTLEKIRYIPGNLLATSSASLANQDRVYCRNERIVLSGNSLWGPFYMVAVGATAVGRVSLTHHEIHTNKKHAREQIITENLPQSVAKGSELGYFELGSTVVLAIGNQVMKSSQLNASSRIKMGETLWF